VLQNGRHEEKEAQNYLQVNILIIELAFGVIPIKRGDIPQCRQITHKGVKGLTKVSCDTFSPFFE